MLSRCKIHKTLAEGRLLYTITGFQDADCVSIKIILESAQTCVLLNSPAMTFMAYHPSILKFMSSFSLSDVAAADSLLSRLFEVEILSGIKKDHLILLS